MYANTHTTASATGMQTTLFRADARSVVRRALGCENNRDAVLFTGTGCTGAIGKMLDLLRGTKRWKAAAASGTPPLVVVGPYEHHSNLLPWRESGCLVVAVQEAAAGGVDMEHLELVLREHADKPLKIGTFSAASNLTGILCDTVAISVALHRHKALAFFDYATAGPYTAIDMNPVVSDPAQAPLAYKDAVFVSPHKFVGGVATPGVLAFKKDILENAVAFGEGAPPALPGGGTVFFVTENDHRYLGNLEEREEAGTPDIVGAIRCGLVMRLKESVGTDAIMERERVYWRMAKKAWTDNSSMHLLGNTLAERLPIVAFNIRKGSQYLHHNFVAALLNDLFGIQVRAGCSCAGPYAQQLLGIDFTLAKQYEAALLQGDEAIRPGLVRLNLNYFLPREVVQYIIHAVSFVAADGWKLLPLYTFIPGTGEWRHRSERKFALRHRRWLSDVRFEDGKMLVRPIKNAPRPATDDSKALSSGLSQELAEQYMAFAAAEASKVEQDVAAGRPFGAGSITETQVASEVMALQSPEAARLRWFMLPSEAVAALKGKPLPSRECAVKDGSVLPCVPAEDAARAHSDETAGGEGVVTAFERFARQQQEVLLQRQPHATFQDVLQVAGEAWRNLSAAQREAFASASPRSPICDLPCESCGAQAAQQGAGNSQVHGGQQDGVQVAQISSLQDGDVKDFAGVQEDTELQKEAVAGQPAGGRELGADSPAACPLKPKQVVEQQEDSAARKKRADKAQKKLMNLVGKAILDFGMIKDGDRVLVGLSGGKDSLSLLHVLMALQRKAPIRFDIGACTVDPQTPEYDPSVLKVYLKQLGVPYFYQSHGIIEQASCSLEKNSICSFCARMKRGILYSTCKREGYGVLALGQHLDDQAESLLMSAFHNGQLRTMKANYTAQEHGVRVIRPLNYCREHLTRDFAFARALPVITENCPGCFEAPKERARIKMVLAQQEQIFPDLYSKLLKAMMPLMAADCADPHAAAVQGLQNSKHAAERAMMSRADNFDDDDDAAPPGKSGQPDGKAALPGGQRGKSSPARSGRMPSDSGAVGPSGPTGASVSDWMEKAGCSGVDAAASSPGRESRSRSVNCDPVTCTAVAAALGGFGVGLVVGMLLRR